MNTWEAIKIQGEIMRGTTGEGQQFWQTAIQGWKNDNPSNTDDIVLIRAVLIEDKGSARILISADYNFNDAKANVLVRRLVDEATEQIKEAIAEDL
ncbi:hypothetical protein ACFPOG_12835 [Paenibacillus aestuarii]|uniref:Uncharacterized protein n=1 Tax=Paenibacillus aestuarii TaxID=516965 RepID=A0ABW0K838_9BACL